LEHVSAKTIKRRWCKETLKMKSFLEKELRDRQDKKEGLTECATYLTYLTYGSGLLPADIARVKQRKRKLLRDVLEFPALPPGANLCRADGA
jgi:hypothetical protein